MPFIHVTTSATLVGLKKSNYNLVCLSDLLMKYHFAPIAGEIFVGGTTGPITNPGVAFADVTSTYWSAESLLRSYGIRGWKTYYSLPAQLEEDIDNLIKNNLQTLNAVIVKLMRDIQKGEACQLQDERKVLLIKEIDAECADVMKLYLRNYIMAVYFKYQPKGLDGYQIQAAFLDHLLNEIPLNFLDLREEEKNAFIDNFPKYFKDTGEAREYEFNDYFVKTIPEDKRKSIAEYPLATVLMEPTRKDFINYYMDPRDANDQLSHTLDSDALALKIKNACNTLSQRVELLKELLNGRGAQPMSVEEKTLCTNSFPVAFILENGRKLENIGKEFRAHTELKLGIDILKIAVDSLHFTQIQDFLNEAGIDNIEIISIDELKRKPKDNLFFSTEASKSLPKSQALTFSLKGSF